MKAPDKIYLHGYDFNENPYRVWSECPVKGMRGYEEINVDYIRKDALLEWIQEVRAIPHENAIARDLAFQEVVSKLNSM